MVEQERLFDSGRGPRRFGEALVSETVQELSASTTAVGSDSVATYLHQFNFLPTQPICQADRHCFPDQPGADEGSPQPGPGPPWFIAQATIGRFVKVI